MWGRVGVLIGLTTLGLGCAPDRWEVFDVDWQEKLESRAQRSVAVPAELRPRPALPPTLPDLEATGPLQLTLEQATLLALAHNRELRVQQYAPVIADAFELLERGRFDPELFADFEYSQETASETARATGEQFSVEGRDTTALAGIRQDLPTGTTVEATVGQDRSVSNRAPEQQEARLGLTVTQSLLQGFGPAVNLATIRQAELETLASTYQLRAFAESLLAQVETTYWNHALAQREIAIFERSLDVARQQRNAVEQRIEVGTLAATEAAAARAEVALREQALIEARSALEAQRLRLLRLMSPSPAGTLDRPVETASDMSFDPQPITDLDARVDLALQLRPEINEALLQLDQARLETIITRNGLLPRLDVFLALGQSGFANTFTESFREIDGQNYDFAAGVRFSHYLNNRAARGADLVARAEREQAAAAVENLRQLVRLDVRLAANEVERARQQIAATTATRTLQEQTVEAEQQRFEVGASTSLLVAQAQRDLLESQINEVQAIVGYRVALINLYLAEGSLLERRGIVLADPLDTYVP